MRAKWALCFAAALTVLSSTSFAEKPTVRIEGSSTVYPLTEAVAEEFQKAKANAVHVTVGISGTGGGFKKFLRKETDINDASRPILEQELEEARRQGVKFIELPIAFDALSVVVNLENTWVDHLTTAELQRIWAPDAQGKVTNWKHVRPNFPDVPLALFGPGSDSGTFDYFTEVIVGKPKASRGDYMASEDDNVLVQGVSKNKGGMGYFGYAYYVENRNRLKVVPIDGGNGPVEPSEETVLKGKYIPLSRPLFIYVNAESLQRPEVAEFINFYLDHIADLANDVGYIPLPKDAYEKAKARVKARQTGTIFVGHSKAAVTVDDLFRGKLHD
ncbi:MAG: PstS family phosphate ABC transporter substrate-binding protein [Candidatus Sumerlaeaceae bacterium]|nr:PstS family phosphate ABC transporter substrate-binding protein [Candidatus Sumerlaeaceae bacterium]